MKLNKLILAASLCTFGLSMSACDKKDEAKKEDKDADKKEGEDKKDGEAKEEEKK